MNERFERYICRKEELFAAEDDPFRHCGEFRLGCFSGPSGGTFSSIEEMANTARHSVESAEVFFAKVQSIEKVKSDSKTVRFQSAFLDGSQNDQVEVHIEPARFYTRRAVVIVPHWNARPGAYSAIAKALSFFGFRVLTLTLPHHGKRGTESDQIANAFLNADLGAAVKSVRQSVSDLRTLVQWLESEGCRDISVVGISLGSCVAALTCAFEPRIRRCALLLTAGDFARVVWTGRATSHIRRELDGHISLQELQEIWSIISPASFLERYGELDTKLLIVSGKRDRVVRFDLAAEFAEDIRSTGAALSWRQLPCGHYTLGHFPFSIQTFALVVAFL